MQIWMQKLVPQHLVSRFVGKLARCRVKWLKNFLIRLFIQFYKVNMSEAVQEDYRCYTTFNEFFTRLLKPTLRSQPSDTAAIACPVDGFISELGQIQDQQLFQAKGHFYDLSNLLGGDHHKAMSFRNGVFFTAYLSPKDYHRVHMPASGTLKKMVHVPGALFSVNPYSVKHVPNLFARNERVICFFESEHGPMAVIMVGAINVASIGIKWHGLVTPPTSALIQQWHYEDNPIHLNRGDEMGYFELGSTAIVLFGKGAVQWASCLSANQAIQLGQPIGRFSSP